MTPLEAIIKNIITILILYFLYHKTPKNLSSNFRSLIILMLLCLLFMFIYVPLRGNQKVQENTKNEFESSYFSLLKIYFSN